MTNKIYVVREHVAFLIFNEYLVLEFWLRYETFFFLSKLLRDMKGSNR